MPGVSQLFAVISLSLLACHASHIMSSCALHLHTCSSHASEHFPHCPFCNSVLLCHPVSLSTSFRVRVLNIFNLDRDLSCGLGLLPVDRLSSFVPFGLRLILQRLTHLNPLHHLSRSITIAWPQTVLNLEPPSSLYL